MKKLALLLTFPLVCYGLTIDEAVKKAVENNLQIKQQEMEIEKSRYQLEQDKNLFMPEFFMDFSYTTMKDTPYTKLPAGSLPFPLSFKQTNKDFRFFDFGINYYIFTGFARIEKIKISKLDIKANRLMLQEQVNTVSAKTKKAYLDVLMARAVVDVYRKQLEAVQKHLERVKEFYKQGLVARIEILQTKVKLSEIQRNLRKAEGELKIAKAVLQNVMNVNESLEVEPVKISLPDTLNIEELYTRALSNRSVIYSLKERVKQINSLEKIELSQFYPKVAAQLKYFYTDQYPYLDPKENYALVLGLQWKFQGAAPYYGYLKRKTENSKLRLRLQEIKNDIKLEVKAAYERFLTAKANLNVAESSLAEAEEYYRMVVEQFKNQLASTTDVLDAESMLTSARKGREISYYQLLKAYVDLEKAVGGSLKDEK
ncbi:TolC family protein [Persephonella sp.]